MKKEFNFALCERRHEIKPATDGSIFPSVINPLDIEGMEKHVEDFLCTLFGGVYKPHVTINLYVTGLTVALIAALNVMRVMRINVVLYHFNRETGDYYSQEVI